MELACPNKPDDPVVPKPDAVDVPVNPNGELFSVGPFDCSASGAAFATDPFDTAPNVLEASVFVAPNMEGWAFENNEVSGFACSPKIEGLLSLLKPNRLLLVFASFLVASSELVAPKSVVAEAAAGFC